MSNELDLQAYFDRIGWRGSREPNLENLSALLAAHMASIPFENFDVLLGRPIRLDLQGLQAKLVTARRGGYCFEHASLFHAVLAELGYAPVRHASRVILFVPRPEAQRSHMFLSVVIDGISYIVDPGFGPFGSNKPIPLDAAPTEATTHWLVQDGAEWVLHIRRDGAVIPAWMTTLEPENPIDFEVANHYIATHPSSFFVSSIMASALTPEGRVNIMNRDVTDLRGCGAIKSELPDRVALRALLQEHFGFDLPEAETLRVPSVADWT